MQGWFDTEQFFGPHEKKEPEHSPTKSSGTPSSGSGGHSFHSVPPSSGSDGHSFDSGTHSFFGSDSPSFFGSKTPPTSSVNPTFTTESPPASSATPSFFGPTTPTASGDAQIMAKGGEGDVATGTAAYADDWSAAGVGFAGFQSRDDTGAWVGATTEADAAQGEFARFEKHLVKRPFIVAVRWQGWC